MDYPLGSVSSEITGRTWTQRRIRNWHLGKAIHPMDRTEKKAALLRGRCFVFFCVFFDFVVVCY